MNQDYIFKFILRRVLLKYPDGELDKKEFRSFLKTRYFDKRIVTRMIEDMIKSDLICLSGKGGCYIIIKKHRLS